MHPPTSSILGRILDRLAFWNVPGFLKSYRLGIPYQKYFVGGLEVWHIPPPDGCSGGPTVLFCHGNAGNLYLPQARGDRFLALHQAGAEVWAFDYRGYGNSPGRPSEEGLYEDALAVHQLARSHHPSGRPFVLFGRSLGGGVATYLASHQEPDALILESTFTSLRDVYVNWAGTRLAAHVSHHFPSQQRLAALSCPLLVIHGTQDWVVPYPLGERLYESSPAPKKLVTIEGAGHNNLQRVAAGRYEKELAEFLNGVSLADLHLER